MDTREQLLAKIEDLKEKRKVAWQQYKHSRKQNKVSALKRYRQLSKIIYNLGEQLTYYGDYTYAPKVNKGMKRVDFNTTRKSNYNSADVNELMMSKAVYEKEQEQLKDEELETYKNNPLYIPGLENVTQEEVSEWLRWCCTHVLTKGQNNAYYFFYNCGYSYAKIGELMGKGKNAVNGNLHFARENFKRYIKTQLLIKECTISETEFDWVRFLQTEDYFFTAMQKRILFLLVTRPLIADEDRRFALHKKIDAKYGNIGRSSSCTKVRVIQNLSKLHLTTQYRNCRIPLEPDVWEAITKEQIDDILSLKPWVKSNNKYNYCCNKD